MFKASELVCETPGAQNSRGSLLSGRGSESLQGLEVGDQIAELGGI